MRITQAVNIDFFCVISFIEVIFFSLSLFFILDRFEICVVLFYLILYSFIILLILYLYSYRIFIQRALIFSVWFVARASFNVFFSFLQSIIYIVYYQYYIIIITKFYFIWCRFVFSLKKKKERVSKLNFLCYLFTFHFSATTAEKIQLN